MKKDICPIRLDIALGLKLLLEPADKWKQRLQPWRAARNMLQPNHLCAQPNRVIGYSHEIILIPQWCVITMHWMIDH